MLIIKRNGDVETFEKEKIKNAIMKSMKYGVGKLDEKCANEISKDAEAKFSNGAIPTVEKIETFVYDELVKHNHSDVAKAYEGYRAVQAFKRQANTTDESIMSLIKGSNDELIKENSNKNGVIIPTQRDLVAGEVSKDITRRKLLPSHIVQAHDNGAIHFHDMDYFLHPMFNCCLINIGDMLDNGTVINDKMIESPKSFQVACTVMTQIIAQIASGQYGGQSINIKHLGKYLRMSYERNKETLSSTISDELTLREAAYKITLKELESGVQTIQYQINTLMTTNGQSPFVTLFLEIPDGDEYEFEISMIVKEILKQRLQGIKNEKGVYITPAFPKLVYVLDEHNCLEGGRYDYITKLAAKCSAKRLYPDYISAKKMKEIYDGNVFSPMGCRSFLSPWYDENGNVKFEGRFNMGVVSINLPQIGLISKNEEEMWDILDKRLKLCKDALLCRYNSLKDVKSDVSPIHWQYGGISRLNKGESIGKLLKSGYATISLGYIGLYELTKIMTGESHTTEKGRQFALRVMKKLRQATDMWKEDTGLGFGLYGTPAESLCYRFAKIDANKFGLIKDITDKGYYTNSYHVDVREEIDAFSKLKFESQFQPISSGGCISYIEIPNMNHNLEAVEEMIHFFYNNIQYAEFNTKSDCCHMCGFDGEIKLNENLEWECPQCGNKNQEKMTVVRRTCGYLGSHFWNTGKTKEIKSRVLHL